MCDTELKPIDSRKQSFQLVANNDENNESGTTQRKRKPNCCQIAWSHFTEYSENTTIHGVKYLGEKHSAFEKCWWILGFALCVTLLIIFISTIWVKWQNSPVIMAIDEHATPIYKIPFPAVTICPETKFDIERFNYSFAYSKLQFYGEKEVSEEDKINFAAISHICNYQNFLSVPSHIWNNITDNLNNETLVDHIKKLALPMNEVLIECKYRNIDECEQLFIDTITEDGMCYTFNLVTDQFNNDIVQSSYPYFDPLNEALHWDWDNGYKIGREKVEFPVRTFYAGKNRALNIFLHTYKRNLNYNCRGTVQGYKIILHAPTDYPQTLKHFIRIPHNREIEIKITPKIISTSDNIKKYDSNRRQCYFSNERKLKHFHHYSEANCKLECIANLTYSLCGCIKYSLPRSSDIPLCGLEKIKCYGPIITETENRMLRIKFQNEMDALEGKLAAKGKKKNEFEVCDCLADCNSIRYDADVDRIDFDFERETADSFVHTTIKVSESENTKVSIYFDEIEYLGQTRTELYGLSDLVSNFGGLMGLFIGGSILSLVELIYFCTIRLCFKLKRDL